MRPRCPFYGFECSAAGAVYRDTGDNRCGLMFNISAPCRRERDGRTVNVDACRLAKAFRRLTDGKERAGQITFFPREHPEGIVYPAWRDEVLAAADRAAEEREKAMREEARKELEAWRRGDTAWRA